MAMDPEFKKMLIALLIALIAVLIVAYTIVELTIRWWGQA